MKLKFIPWIGGKSRIVNQLVELMPEHRCFVEMFGGGGVFILNKAPSFNEIYNDIDKNLVNLFLVVKNYNEEFYGCLLGLPNRSRYLFETYKKDYEVVNIPDIEKASVFFYLIKNSFSTRFPNPTYAYGVKVPKSHFDIGSIKNNLSQLMNRLKYVAIENLDYRDLIKRYDDPETFWFIDPPYYFEHGEMPYKYSFTAYDHMELFHHIKKLKGKFLITYNNSNFLKELYKDFNQELINFKYSAANTRSEKKKELTSHGEEKTELLIYNYDRPTKVIQKQQKQMVKLGDMI